MKAPVFQQDDAVKTTATPTAADIELPWKLHEACAALPLMPPVDFAAMCADIAANGLREPLTFTPEACIAGGRVAALADVGVHRSPQDELIVTVAWLAADELIESAP